MRSMAHPDPNKFSALYGHGEEITHDLRTAISNLKKFAQLNAAEPIPHFFQIDMEEGQLVSHSINPYQKIVGLARCFVTALLSDSVRRSHEQRRDRLQEELLRAIDIIKNSYPLLDKLKEGDPAQRKLAEAAIATIDHFNEVLQGSQSHTPSWGKRFARFLFQRSGLSVDDRLASQTIELPLTAILECQSPRDTRSGQQPYHRVTANPQSGASSVASRRVSLVTTTLQGPNQVCLLPTRREIDAFRVKAITMIRNYGFPSTSLSEALKAVRHSPIQSAASETTMGLKGEDATIVTFRQTLEPFPGELLLLEGSFRRDAHSKVASIPIPDSFRLFSRSSQSGFPHPIQHNGWGLCDKLMPICPDAPGQVPLYRTLTVQKRKVAQALLPLGTMLPRAKQLLEMKKELYEAHQDTFLELHHRLAIAIIDAGDKSSQVPVIDELFRSLDNAPGAVERLAQAYATVCETYVNKPLDSLQSAWLQARNSGDWLAYTPSHRHALARQLFLHASKAAEEELIIDRLPQISPQIAAYILLLGSLFREPACDIALQYMSEKISFEPPVLDTFALKLQTNVFRQMMAFLVDLEIDLGPDLEEQRDLIKDRLVLSLEADIACFEACDPVAAGKNVSALARELSAYYTERATR